MNSEFRLCPACRAPNTVQDAVCAACGTRLPAVAKAPVPTFETIPGRQEARQAARTGVRRGLVVGLASAAILGLLVARTFRAPSLQDGSAQTAALPTPPPAATPQPGPVAAAPALPAVPAGWERPNPYASPANPYATASLPGSLPSPAAVPATVPASVPAVIIAAPPAGARPAPAADAAPARDSKPASYTDADLARVRNEAETGMEPGGPPATAPSPRSPAQDEGREKRVRERREAVRAAQQRVDEAQSAVDEIRREARENDDDGLQEELSDALSELKSAQRDLARARRRLQEVEDQPTAVLPPQ
jgi:hypothetical protein